MKRKSSDAAVYFDRVREFEVYKNVDCVVMLIENMRHRSDPTWRDILRRWRYGDYIQSDIDFVNRICFTENWTSTHANLTSYCPIMVTSNAL